MINQQTEGGLHKTGRNHRIPKGICPLRSSPCLAEDSERGDTEKPSPSPQNPLIALCESRMNPRMHPMISNCILQGKTGRQEVSQRRFSAIADLLAETVTFQGTPGLARRQPESHCRGSEFQDVFKCAIA